MRKGTPPNSKKWKKKPKVSHNPDQEQEPENKKIFAPNQTEADTSSLTLSQLNQMASFFGNTVSSLVSGARGYLKFSSQELKVSEQEEKGKPSKKINSRSPLLKRISQIIDSAETPELHLDNTLTLEASKDEELELFCEKASSNLLPPMDLLLKVNPELIKNPSSSFLKLLALLGNDRYNHIQLQLVFFRENVNQLQISDLESLLIENVVPKVDYPVVVTQESEIKHDSPESLQLKQFENAIIPKIQQRNIKKLTETSSLSPLSSAELSETKDINSNSETSLDIDLDSDENELYSKPIKLKQLIDLDSKKDQKEKEKFLNSISSPPIQTEIQLQVNVEQVQQDYGVEQNIQALQQIAVEESIETTTEIYGQYDGELIDLEKFQSEDGPFQKLYQASCQKLGVLLGSRINLMPGLANEQFGHRPNSINYMSPDYANIVAMNYPVLAFVNTSNLPKICALKKSRDGGHVAIYDSLAERKQNIFTPPSYILYEKANPIYDCTDRLPVEKLSKLIDNKPLFNLICYEGSSPRKYNPKRLANLWIKFGDDGIQLLFKQLKQCDKIHPKFSVFLFEHYLKYFFHWDLFLNADHYLNNIDLLTCLSRISLYDSNKLTCLKKFLLLTGYSKHNLVNTLDAFDFFWGRFLNLCGANTHLIPKINTTWETPLGGNPIVYMERMLTILENARDLEDQLNCLTATGEPIFNYNGKEKIDAYPFNNKIILNNYGYYDASKYRGYKIVAPEMVLSYEQENSKEKFCLTQQPYQISLRELMHQADLVSKLNVYEDKEIPNDQYLSKDFFILTCRFLGMQSHGIKIKLYTQIYLKFINLQGMSTYWGKHATESFYNRKILIFALATSLLFLSHDRHSDIAEETSSAEKFRSGMSLMFSSTFEEPLTLFECHPFYTLMDSLIQMHPGHREVARNKLYELYQKDYRLNLNEAITIFEQFTRMDSSEFEYNMFYTKKISQKTETIELFIKNFEKSPLPTHQLLKLINKESSSSSNRTFQPTLRTAEFLHQEPKLYFLRDYILIFSYLVTKNINHYLDEEKLPSEAYAIETDKSYQWIDIIKDTYEKMTRGRKYLVEIANNKKFQFAFQTIMSFKQRFTWDQFLKAFKEIEEIEDEHFHTKVDNILRDNNCIPEKEEYSHDPSSIENEIIKKHLIQIIIQIKENNKEKEKEKVGSSLDNQPEKKQEAPKDHQEIKDLTEKPQTKFFEMSFSELIFLLRTELKTCDSERRSFWERKINNQLPMILNVLFENAFKIKPKEENFKTKKPSETESKTRIEFTKIEAHSSNDQDSKDKKLQVPTLKSKIHTQTTDSKISTQIIKKIVEPFSTTLQLDAEAKKKIVENFLATLSLDDQTKINKFTKALHDKVKTVPELIEAKDFEQLNAIAARLDYIHLLLCDIIRAGSLGNIFLKNIDELTHLLSKINLEKFDYTATYSLIELLLVFITFDSAEAFQCIRTLLDHKAFSYKDQCQILFANIHLLIEEKYFLESIEPFIFLLTKTLSAKKFELFHQLTNLLIEVFKNKKDDVIKQLRKNDEIFQPEIMLPFLQLLNIIEPDSLNLFIKFFGLLNLQGSLTDFLKNINISEEKAEDASKQLNLKIFKIIFKTYTNTPKESSYIRLDFINSLVNKIRSLGQEKVDQLLALLEDLPLRIIYLKYYLDKYRPSEPFDNFLLLIDQQPFGPRPFAAQRDTSQVERVINESEYLNNGSIQTSEHRTKTAEIFYFIHACCHELPFYLNRAPAIKLRSREIREILSTVNENKTSSFFEKSLYVLPLLCEAMYRATEQYPFSTQILALIDTLILGKKVFSVIDTGQGKSLLDAIKAVLLWLAAGLTNVITSSLLDAEKEIDIYGKFFKFLQKSFAKLPITVVSDYKDYQADGINYTTTEGLALFYIKACIENPSLRIKIEQAATIINEADWAILFEQIIHRFALVNPVLGTDNEWIYYAVNELIQEKSFKLPKSAREDILLLKHFLITKTYGLNKSKRIIEKLPTAQLFTWINSALLVRYKLKNKFDFILPDEKEFQMINGVKRETRAIKILLPNGHRSQNSTYGEAIQQLLCAHLNTTLYQGKEEFVFSSESKNIVSLTNYNLIKIFNKNYIWSSSATPGSQIDVQYMYGQFGFLFSHTQPHQKNQIQSFEPKIFDDEKSQFSYTYSKVFKIKKTTLIFCKDIETSDRLYQFFLADQSNSSRIKIQHYYGQNGGAEYIKKAGEPRMITICTTVFGRNTDIHYDNDMVVMATFMGSDSDMMQMRGRTGRQGSKGSFYIFLNRQDLIHQEIKDSKSDASLIQIKKERIREQWTEKRKYNRELLTPICFLFSKILELSDDCFRNTKRTFIMEIWSNFSVRSEKQYKNSKLNGTYVYKDFVARIIENFVKLLQSELLFLPQEFEFKGEDSKVDPNIQISKFLIKQFEDSQTELTFQPQKIYPRKVKAAHLTPIARTAYSLMTVGRPKVSPIQSDEKEKKKETKSKEGNSSEIHENLTLLFDSAKEGMVFLPDIFPLGSNIEEIRKPWQNFISNFIQSKIIEFQSAGAFSFKTSLQGIFFNRNYLFIFSNMTKILGEPLVDFTTIKDLLLALIEEYSTFFFIHETRKDILKEIKEKINGKDSPQDLIKYLITLKIKTSNIDKETNRQRLKPINFFGDSRLQTTLDFSIQLIIALTGQQINEQMYSQLLQGMQEDQEWSSFSHDEKRQELEKREKSNPVGYKGMFRLLNTPTPNIGPDTPAIKDSTPLENNKEEEFNDHKVEPSSAVVLPLSPSPSRVPENQNSTITIENKDVTPERKSVENFKPLEDLLKKEINRRQRVNSFNTFGEVDFASSDPFYLKALQSDLKNVKLDYNNFKQVLLTYVNKIDDHTILKILFSFREVFNIDSNLPTGSDHKKVGSTPTLGNKEISINNFVNQYHSSTGFFRKCSYFFGFNGCTTTIKHLKIFSKISNDTLNKEELKFIIDWRAKRKPQQSNAAFFNTHQDSSKNKTATEQIIDSLNSSFSPKATHKI